MSYGGWNHSFQQLEGQSPSKLQGAHRQEQNQRQQQQYQPYSGGEGEDNGSSQRVARLEKENELMQRQIIQMADTISNLESASNSLLSQIIGKQQQQQQQNTTSNVDILSQKAGSALKPSPNKNMEEEWRLRAQKLELNLGENEGVLREAKEALRQRDDEIRSLKKELEQNSTVSREQQRMNKQECSEKDLQISRLHEQSSIDSHRLSLLERENKSLKFELDSVKERNRIADNGFHETHRQVSDLHSQLAEARAQNGIAMKQVQQLELEKDRLLNSLQPYLQIEKQFGLERQEIVLMMEKLPLAEAELQRIVGESSRLANELLHVTDQKYAVERQVKESDRLQKDAERQCRDWKHKYEQVIGDLHSIQEQLYRERMIQEGTSRQQNSLIDQLQEQNAVLISNVQSIRETKDMEITQLHADLKLLRAKSIKQDECIRLFTQENNSQHEQSQMPIGGVARSWSTKNSRTSLDQQQQQKNRFFNSSNNNSRQLRNSLKKDKSDMTRSQHRGNSLPTHISFDETQQSTQSVSSIVPQHTTQSAFTQSFRQSNSNIKKQSKNNNSIQPAHQQQQYLDPYPSFSNNSKNNYVVDLTDDSHQESSQQIPSQQQRRAFGQSLDQQQQISSVSSLSQPSRGLNASKQRSNQNVSQNKDRLGSSSRSPRVAKTTMSNLRNSTKTINHANNKSSNSSINKQNNNNIRQNTSLKKSNQNLTSSNSFLRDSTASSNNNNMRLSYSNNTFKNDSKLGSNPSTQYNDTAGYDRFRENNDNNDNLRLSQQYNRNTINDRSFGITNSNHNNNNNNWSFRKDQLLTQNSGFIGDYDRDDDDGYQDKENTQFQERVQNRLSSSSSTAGASTMQQLNPSAKIKKQSKFSREMSTNASLLPQQSRNNFSKYEKKLTRDGNNEDDINDDNNNNHFQLDLENSERSIDHHDMTSHMARMREFQECPLDEFIIEKQQSAQNSERNSYMGSSNNNNYENHHSSNNMRSTNSYSNNKDALYSNLDYPAYDRINKRQTYY